MVRFVVLAALSLAPVSALADSLPNCPPGSHFVSFPTPPGALHHGGGQCAPDEPSGEAPPATPEVAGSTPSSAATAPEAPGTPAAAPSGGLCSARRATGGGGTAAALGLVAFVLVRRRAR
jgi:hypothetical protein